MFFKSLKKEILIFTLGLTVVTIVVTAWLGVYSTQTAGRDAEEASEGILREQAKESLVQIAESTAQRQDLLFERTRDDASSLAAYTKNMYENPLLFSTKGYWRFDDRVLKKDGLYLNDESDVSTFFIPNFVIVDAEAKKALEHTAYLDFVVPGILKNNQNAVAIYSVDKRSISRYFPNIILGGVAPPEYDVTKDDLYVRATPKENPEKKVTWSALYDDPAERGLMITAAAPIYTKDGFQGIIGIDVLLNSIIKTITAYSPIEGSYAFLIDKEGSTIAFPDKAYEDILGRIRKEGEIRTDLKEASSQEFSAILKGMTSGAKGFGSIQTKGEEELFIAYAPLPQTGFSLGIVAEEAVMLKAAKDLQREISSSIRSTVATRVLPISALIVLVASIIGIFLVTRIVKPIRQLTKGAHEIGSGNLDYNLTIESKNEIGDLASSFNQMGKSLKESREEIQQAYEVEKKARIELEELDKAKDQFILTTQHHLRTPLTIVKGYLQSILTQKATTLDPTTKTYVVKAQESADRIALLVNEFLDISQMEVGKSIINKTPANVADLLNTITKELESEIQGKNISVVLDFQQKDTILNVDVGKMKEALTNLLDNAVKYSKEGGEIRVEGGAVHHPIEREKLIYRLTIEDTGIGILPEELPKLFIQYFQRGKEAEKVYTTGRGIGLAVTKNIITAHNGRIWAESQGENKGSRFIVELPV